MDCGEVWHTRVHIPLAIKHSHCEDPLSFHAASSSQTSLCSALTCKTSDIPTSLRCSSGVALALLV